MATLLHEAIVQDHTIESLNRRSWISDALAMRPAMRHLLD